MLRSALLRAAIVTMVAVPTGVTATAADVKPLAPGAVRLRVVTADGLAAGGVQARLLLPEAMFKGDGRMAVVHLLKTDRNGLVDIAFPDDDPYVLAHPGQDEFNVEVQFIARPAAGLVSESLVTFPYNRRTHQEVTVVPVSGRTFALSKPQPDDPPPNPLPDCDPGPEAAAYMCSQVTEPAGMRAVPTVLMTNAGAGFDTTVKITYEEAGRIQTSVGHERGFGMISVGGAVTVESDSNLEMVYSGGNVRFGSLNEYAVVHTKWVAIERQYCERPSFPFSGPPTCSHDGTSWYPKEAVGGAQLNKSSEHKIWHDRYCEPYSPSDCPDGAYMHCITQFPTEYARGFGTEQERAYTADFELGANVWPHVELKASARYTRSDKNSKLAAYRYTALNPETYNHYLWTYTNLPYDQTAPGGGICPEVNIGDTWTTTERPAISPSVPETAEGAADTVDDTVRTPTDTDPGAGERTRSAGRCANVPEDCRPGVVARELS